MKVVSFGEILWDIIEGQPHLGGAPFNFAAHTAQCGNNSFIISRLGNDDLGKKAFSKCSQHHVNTDWIQWDLEHPTGMVNVTLQNGQPDYVIEENAAYDFIEFEENWNSFLKTGIDVFYFGSLIQRNSHSAHTLYKILDHFRFREVFYDVNLRKKGYSETIVRKSLGYCTVLKLNIDEVPILSKYFWNAELAPESFCHSLTSDYPKINTIIVTAAERGCMIYQNKKLVSVPGVPVKVADAVGAGDAFSAAFMHRYIKDGDALMAAAIANQMGAYVASQPGAIPPYTNDLKKQLGIS